MSNYYTNQWIEVGLNKQAAKETKAAWELKEKDAELERLSKTLERLNRQVQKKDHELLITKKVYNEVLEKFLGDI